MVCNEGDKEAGDYREWEIRAYQNREDDFGTRELPVLSESSLCLLRQLARVLRDEILEGR